MEMNRMKELPLHIHDENNGFDYTLHGDYYLPNTLPVSCVTCLSDKAESSLSHRQSL